MRQDWRRVRRDCIPRTGLIPVLVEAFRSGEGGFQTRRRLQTCLTSAASDPLGSKLRTRRTGIASDCKPACQFWHSRRKTMCRSIKVLRRPETPVTTEEIAAASLQFVRKVSGYRKPSKTNQPAFDAAVREIAEATERLMRELGVEAQEIVTRT